MIKRIISATLLALFIISLAACAKARGSSSQAEEKIFGHAELRIDLSDDFTQFTAQGFDAAYSSSKCVVGIYRVSFEACVKDGIPDFLTPEQFARVYKSDLGRDVEIQKHGLVPYYEYTETTGEIQNSYLVSFYRSRFAYFAVAFACPKDSFSEMKSEFLSYADTVIFEYK